MGRQTPAALASLNHMRRHVQASQGELDHVLKFHTPVSFLSQEERQILMILSRKQVANAFSVERGL